MVRYGHVLAVVIGALAAPCEASAQVNVEILRPNPLRAGLSGGLDGSFALSRGNIELLDVGGATRIQYQILHRQAQIPEGQPRPLPFIAQRLSLTSSGRFADRAGGTIVNQAFAYARWTAMWHRRVGSELFAQYQYNEFLRLQARALVGLGVRVEIIHEHALMSWAGTAYMPEYNRIRSIAGAPDAPETLDHRLANHLAIRLSLLEDRILLQSTLYVQPRLDDFQDIRILEELEILSKITDLFAFGTTLGILFDSAPPTQVKSTDLRLLTTIRLSF